MRIGLVSDTYTPQVNGVSTIVRRIVDALGEAGHDVAVIAPRYPEVSDRSVVPELRVPSLPFPPYPAIRLSRLRVHHLSDVLAGAALGLAGAIVATKLVG